MEAYHPSKFIFQQGLEWLYWELYFFRHSFHIEYIQDLYLTRGNVYHRTYLITHWGQVTHICVSKLTTAGSDNGLSPDRRLAIIWSNARMLLIKHLETKFSENWIKFHTFSFKKMHVKISSAKSRSCCLGLSVSHFHQLKVSWAIVKMSQLISKLSD